MHACVKCEYMMTSSTGNSFRVTGHLCAQRPVTRGFDVFFDLRPDKQLSKQSSGWWFETPSHSLWRHHNEDYMCLCSGSVNILRSVENYSFAFHRAWTLNDRNVAANRTDKQHNDAGNGNKNWSTVITGYVKTEYTGTLSTDDIPTLVLNELLSFGSIY